MVEEQAGETLEQRARRLHANATEGRIRLDNLKWQFVRRVSSTRGKDGVENRAEMRQAFETYIDALHEQVVLDQMLNATLEVLAESRG